MKTTASSRPGVTVVVRLLAALSSLRLAVLLLSVFTLCLACATLLEAAHGQRVAQDLVYRAWWFAGLLVLLALNVLGAAVKKYPWRRHQIGFLVTHSGLLLLLLGGLLTTLLGVEGQMILVDTPSPALHRRLGVSDTTDRLYLDGSHEIQVIRRQRGNRSEQTWTYSLEPGTFVWTSDEYARRELPLTLAVLDGLARPFNGYCRSLDDGTRLVVENFYPDVRVRASRAGGEGAQPAFRGRLESGSCSEEFLIALGFPAAEIRLGEDRYLVRLRPATVTVDFRVTLRRAWQLRDPGSDRPAWFQSDVVLSDGTTSSEHSISMNATVRHGLYKVYQANYRLLEDPTTSDVLREGDRAVSLSGLNVAHDPGLWPKYIGSLVVALGIAIMFTTRTAFFRPRDRK